MEKIKLSSVALLVTDIDAPTGGIQKNSRLLLREFGKRGIGAFASVRNYYGLPNYEASGGAIIHRSPVIGRSMAVNGMLYLADTFRWLVWNRKKYDVIHCQQLFGPTMAAAVASFLIRKPIVTRITVSGETGEVNAIKTMPLSGLRLRLIRRVSRWVALTREMKSELETLGIPSERIRVIYNSTEIPETTAYCAKSQAAMRRKLGLKYEKIVVFVGRLSEEKRLDVLIDAWKTILLNHPDAHLLLLGQGGEYRNVEGKLRDQVSRLGIDDVVHFLGHVENAKEYVLASDVFVLPTRAEGMSNSLVEAFACGATIVATDIPANSEICTDDLDSILVPVGDAETLSSAISRVLDHPEVAKRLGMAARRKAENELSIDKMIANYISVYEELVSAAK